MFKETDDKPMTEKETGNYRKEPQMKTAPDKSQTTFSGIFKWRSLKTRLTLFILTIFLVGIWSLALYASYTLKKNLENLLSDQQFSTVSIVASDINNGLEERIKSLEMIASKITPAMLGNATSLQIFLESHVSFPILFNYGGIVLRHDGVAIAEVPNHGRIGINYSGRDYMIEVLKGKTTISRTVMGKTSRSPFFSMLTPIRDTKGNIIGVLAGATDLGKPNFLSKITDHSYGKTGGYLLVSPEIRTIVYATDKKRIMEVLPERGVNPFYDKSINEGWEGSGLSRTPSGVEVLVSIKHIPISGWNIIGLIPTEEAFAPVHVLQKRMLLATIFLSLLAGGLTMLVLKRQLAPIFTTIKTLATLSDSDQHPQPLAITRQDEIGDLIGGFNRLLDILGLREATLRHEQQFSKLLLDSLPGIFYLYTYPELRLVLWNRQHETLLGYTTEETEGKYVTDWHLPENKEAVSKAVDGVMEQGHNSLEGMLVAKDGHQMPFFFTGVRFEARDRLYFMGIGIDITERRQAQDELIEQLKFLQILIDTIPIPVFFKDCNGIYLGCNKACEFFLGPRDQLLGKTVYDVSPKDIADIYNRADLELFNNPGIHIYESVAVDTDGGKHN